MLVVATGNLRLPVDECAELLDQLLRTVHDESHARLQPLAAHLQCVGDARQRPLSRITRTAIRANLAGLRPRALQQMLPQPARVLAQALLVAGRQRHQARHTARPARRLRSTDILLQYQMRVGAAGTEGAQRRPARITHRPPLLEQHRRLPGLQRALDGKGRAPPVDVRVQFLRVQRRHQRSVVQLQHRLDQSGDPGGRLGMADVGFNRADRTELTVLCVTAKRLGQPLNLDRIPQRGARAVRLHIADAARRHRALVQAGVDQLRLRHRTGHGKPAHRPHMIDATGLDECVNVIPVLDRLAQRLQQHRRHGLPGHIPVPAVAKATAAPVAGVHVHQAVRQVLGRMQRQIHSAGQRRGALPAADALHPQMHRHQRRGAHRIHRYTRTVEIAAVGHSIGDGGVALRHPG